MFESARTLTQAHAAHTHTTNLHATEQVRLEMRFQHHRRRRLMSLHAVRRERRGGAEADQAAEEAEQGGEEAELAAEEAARASVSKKMGGGAENGLSQRSQESFSGDGAAAVRTAAEAAAVDGRLRQGLKRRVMGEASLLDVGARRAGRAMEVSQSEEAGLTAGCAVPA